MSRAGVSRVLVALVAVASLVSCMEGDVEAQFDAVAPSVDSVRIKFSCGAVDSIALIAPNGAPAWAVRRKPNNPISWVVDSNVTIHSIGGTSPNENFPIDSAGPQGGAPGVPFSGKVKGGTPNGSYHYVIDASCQPASGPARRLVIDPEMIVR